EEGGKRGRRRRLTPDPGPERRSPRGPRPPAGAGDWQSGGRLVSVHGEARHLPELGLTLHLRRWA
ncbi:hypothetical protein P7K49_038225, partial [Saguinus oedipus]